MEEFSPVFYVLRCSFFRITWMAPSLKDNLTLFCDVLWPCKKNLEVFYRGGSSFDPDSSRKETLNYLSLLSATWFALVCCLHWCLKGIFSDNSGGTMTFCPALYCWVMFERAFFFLASSSCFLRCSSCSFRSFSSCWQHIRCGVRTGKEPHPSEHNAGEPSC